METALRRRQIQPAKEPVTVVVRGVDSDLLKRQASALGRVIGPPGRRPTGRERELLEGVWEMLHVMLDDLEE